MVSAELVLVPAMPPRDVGFDRSMVAAYGHDDKIAAYGAVKALLQQDKPDYFCSSSKESDVCGMAIAAMK